MLKKTLIIIIAGLLMFSMSGCGGEEISLDDLKPTEGILLATIDGEPYYYDPIYIFKVTGGAFPQVPDTEEKKRALVLELAYMESVGRGDTISDDSVAKEFEMRKMTVAGWEDSITSWEESLEERIERGVVTEETIAQEEKELLELRDYVQRYDKIWSQCTEEAGITEEEYWEGLPLTYKKEFS